MRLLHRSSSVALVLLLGCACGSGSEGNGAGAGSGGLDGATGGSVPAGVGGSGEYTAESGTTQGGSSLGGATSPSGGWPGAGGTPNWGGAGTATTGGSPGTGGSPITGGAPSTGGTPATGGAPGGAGPVTTGGAFGTGGSSGAVATGGTPGVGGSASAGGAPGGVFPSGAVTPKLMIIGDSISAGPGCYKGYLLQKLHDGGFSGFEFVGEYSDDCGSSVRHSATSCATAKDYTQASFTLPNCFGENSFPGLAPLMAQHSPDLVMIQLGVNDIWGGSTTTEGVLASYDQLVQQARAQNPNVVLVVAQIHKIITDGCSNAASTAAAEALVDAVPGWAETHSTPESPVFVADLWTNSDPYEAEDCVHPDDAGAQRMADNWYEALREILPAG